MRDEIDIADASRPIKDEEAATCEAAGIDFTELRIGLDGLADSTCVEPSNETVESGKYVLSRPPFIYVKKSALTRPEVREFVRYYLETTPELIADVGYDPGPAEDFEKGVEALKAAG